MNKLKKILSVCLVLVMVLGMLGSSIPTNATNSINAMITGITPHEDKGLIVLNMASDGDALAEHLYVDITVGTKVNNSLYLHYNAPIVGGSQYLIFVGAQEAGTQVKFGGAVTITNGKTVNIPQTTLEWTGTLWAKVVEPVDSTVGTITQPSRTDNLIVIDLISDEVLPEGTFTGKIKVGETEKDVSLVFNYSNNDYSKNYYFDPGVKDTNTLVVISGIFSGTNGKINIAETTFLYTGTQWEKDVELIDVTVGEITQPSRTDNLIVIDIESDEVLPEGTFTGKIKVGETEEDTSLVFNYSNNDYSKNYYFAPSVKDTNTLVVISGVFRGANGKINIAETTFQYTGTEWKKYIPVDATVGAITQPSRIDNLIVIDLISDEVLPEGTFTGKIKVGEIEEDASLVFNYRNNDYSKNYYFTPSVKDTNTLVVISGVFSGANGKINIAETIFQYTGTAWEKYVEPVDATVDAITQPTRDDNLIVIDITSDEVLPEGTFTGKIKVGETEKDVSLVFNYSNNDYSKNYYFDPGVKDTNTLVVISGIFRGANGKINIAEATFQYTGTAWKTYVPANVSFTGFYLQEETDTHIRMTVNTNDTFDVNTAFTGEFYVNGQLNTNLGFAKSGDYHYAVFTDSIAVTKGTRIKLGGLYKASDNRGIKFEEITFVYNGSDWAIYVPATVRAIRVQETDNTHQIVDRHLRIIAKVDDTFIENATLAGDIYVNGDLNKNVQLKKSDTSNYIVDMSNVNVTKGTTIKLGGIYTTTGGSQVDFDETTFVYNGTDWEIDGAHGNARVRAVVGQTTEDKHIRMSVTTDDTIAVDTELIGSIFVDGKINSQVTLCKSSVEGYTVITDNITVVEGTTIRLGGNYRGGGKNVNFADVVFVYHGTEWQLRRIVSVGTEKEGIVEIHIADGEKLPTGYIEDKYIIDWNVETYSDNNADYVADHIDLDMLNAKLQARNTAQEQRMDVRFIASVDTLNYRCVGFVFSLKNEIPDMSKDPKIELTTVYKVLLAEGERMTVDAVYGDEGCSANYMFAYAMEGIPFSKVIYTRAYVQLNDGTYVWGEVANVAVDTVGTVTDDAKLNLVTDGSTEYVILHGKNATATEIHAAKELQSYLKKISGIILPIVTDDTQAKEKEIIVGKTNRETEGQFDREELGEDGLIIKTTDSKLWLVGGGDRGTIYSVYTFLEEYLGCGFYTKYVEKIPERKNIALHEIQEDKQIPVFEYRDVAWTDYTDHTREDLSVKRKINAALWDRKLSEKVGGGYNWALDTGGHTFNRLVPAETYFTEHPEYFAMGADGNRFTMDENGNCIANGQLCLSNPDIPRIIIAEARKWLIQDPDTDIISISQNDLINPCLCADCKAIYKEEGGAYSGAILRVVNAVAEDLKKDYPDLIVDTYAYQYSRSAPTKTKPADNVNIRLCTIEGCFSHAHEEECDMAYVSSYIDGSANVFAQDLEDWSKLCDGNLWVYDYNCNFYYNGMTFPDFDNLLANYRWYASHGVTGVMPEGQWGTVSYEFGALRSYLLSKVLWNPYMSEEEFQTYVDEFLEAVYGPGWNYIRDYIELAEELTEDIHFSLSVETGIEYMYPLNTIQKHTSAELPQDLTLDMIKNQKYKEVDWTKYWNWYSDVEENRITVEGDKLFKKAMELAETENQKLELEKTYLQIENMRSYYYGKQLSVGKETFAQLIDNLIATAGFIDKITLSTQKGAIVNEAYKQCSSAYAEYNRDLCERMLEWGVITNDNRKLGDAYRFDFTTVPCYWWIDDTIKPSTIEIPELSGDVAKVSVELTDYHNPDSAINFEFGTLEKDAPQYIGAGADYSFDVAVPKGLEGKGYLLTPLFPAYSSITADVTVEEDGWVYVLTQGIYGLQEGLKRQGFKTIALYPQGTLATVHSEVPLVMMGKEAKAGETISWTSNAFGILIADEAVKK